jgi:hypothetical protein
VYTFSHNYALKHKDFQYADLLKSIKDKFNFSDMTDEDLNQCIQEGWGSVVEGSTYHTLQNQAMYYKIFNNAKIQNELLAVALTKIKDPLLIKKLTDNINPKQARILFKKFPVLKDRLPRSLKSKIYPTIDRIIPPLIMVGLLSPEQIKKFDAKRLANLPWNKGKPISKFTRL